MKLRNVRNLLLSAAAAISAGQTIYAQATPFAVVPPSSIQPGEARPYLWMQPDGANAVHGPGQTSCASGCYYFPSDIRTAYTTSYIQNANGGQGITVGIVDAFYNSQTEADLATFNSDFGLPACTIASGCLTIVNQTGGAPSAGFNQGWAQETDLDVQWVHAIAPNAKILLVTADTNSFANLATAVAYARAHADVVSNSYGSTEFAGESGLDSTYSASTVPIIFSSGDTGAVVQYPCASPFVTCVGGTSLLETSTSYRNLESAWGSGGSGSGGGCSTQESAPSYESGFSTCGSFRGVPDVAALADPNTGALVYLGTNAGGTAGLYIFGGTSLACPIFAALVADIDAARVTAGKAKLGVGLNQLIYQAAANPYYNYRFYDVKTGSSGFPATTGWDKATGLGVPLSPSLANYLVNIVP